MLHGPSAMRSGMAWNTGSRKLLVAPSSKSRPRNTPDQVGEADPGAQDLLRRVGRGLVDLPGAPHALVLVGCFVQAGIGESVPASTSRPARGAPAARSTSGRCSRRPEDVPGGAAEELLEPPGHVLDALVGLGVERGRGDGRRREVIGQRRRERGEQVRHGSSPARTRAMCAAGSGGRCRPARGGARRVHDVAGRRGAASASTPRSPHVVLQLGVTLAAHAREVEVPCPLDHNAGTLPALAGAKAVPSERGSVLRERSSRRDPRRARPPVIDIDGHCVEYFPGLADYLRDEGCRLGRPEMSRLLPAVLRPDQELARARRRRARRRPRVRPPWWGAPAENTRDLATVAVPRPAATNASTSSASTCRSSTRASGSSSCICVDERERRGAAGR